MKRNKRTLIVLAVVVIVLVAAILALLLPDQLSGDTASSSVSSSTTSTLYEYASKDLKSLQVKNKSGSFTIVPDAEATAKAESEAAASAASSASSAATTTVDTVFKVQELEGLPLNTSAVASAAKDGYVFATVKTVTTAEDDQLENYGLTDSTATAKWTSTFTNGTTKTLLVGSQTPLDSTSYYVREEGSNTVYAANVDSSLLGSVTGLVSNNVTNYQAPDDDAGTGASTASSPFQQIAITNQQGSFTLSRSGKGADWSVDGQPASGDAVSTLSSGLAALTADSVAAIHPDSAALTKYGFNAPAAKASLKLLDGSSQTLLIGGTDSDGKYYAMLQGGQVVYLLPSSGLSWLTQSAIDLRDLKILSNEVTDIASFQITGSKSYDFEVTRKEDTASSTEDNKSYTYSATVNGKAVSDYSTYETFFTAASNLQILEAAGANDKPSGTPAQTITLTGYDKSVHHVYQFYTSGNRRYLVVADGKVFGLMNVSDFDALLESATTVK